VDVPALIRKALREFPDASTDEIVRQLNAWGVQVSGAMVGMWRAKAARSARDSRPSADEAPDDPSAPASEQVLYCACPDDPCTCGRSKPSSWRQYCCGVPVAPDQLKARDKFLETVSHGAP
jgi:hypothetical protein